MPQELKNPEKVELAKKAAYSKSVPAGTELSQVAEPVIRNKDEKLEAPQEETAITDIDSAHVEPIPAPTSATAEALADSLIAGTVTARQRCPPGFPAVKIDVLSTLLTAISME